VRFLIDENLSPALAAIARERGHEAMAVRDLGLLNAKDWTLLEVAKAGDWILVTNNVEEFRRRYARRMELHAGVVFLAGVDGGRDVQLAAFRAALDDIDTAPDVVNVELLVTRKGDGAIVILRRPLP
jgi:predicted nuclease of predicted toxin-antitoxin system